jgi:hypothetical protein
VPRTSRPVKNEAAASEWLRDCVDESLNDPQPSRPAGKVFKRLRAYHAARSKSRTLRR